MRALRSIGVLLVVILSLIILLAVAGWGWSYTAVPMVSWYGQRVEGSEERLYPATGLMLIEGSFIYKRAKAVRPPDPPPLPEPERPDPDTIDPDAPPAPRRAPRPEPLTDEEIVGTRFEQRPLTPSERDFRRRDTPPGTLGFAWGPTHGRSEATYLRIPLWSVAAGALALAIILALLLRDRGEEGAVEGVERGPASAPPGPTAHSATIGRPDAGPTASQPIAPPPDPASPPDVTPPPQEPPRDEPPR